MKKLLALILALTVVVGVFAACNNTPAAGESTPAADQSTPAADESTPAAEESTPAAEESTPAAGENTVTASALSNHENGWEVEAWHEGTAGVYFNMWTNDLPYNADWSVRYQPHSGDVVKLIRNGETHMIGGPGIEQLVKFSANAYYLSFDNWIVPDLFPLQEGDVVIIEGDFSNPENGYTIHFDKTYVQCKTGGITKFTTEAPEGITE